MTKEQKWLNTITDFDIYNWVEGNSELSLTCPDIGDAATYRVENELIVNRFNQMKEEIAINAIDKFCQFIKDSGQLSGEDTKFINQLKSELLNGEV